jgi:hypothetical protein
MQSCDHHLGMYVNCMYMYLGIPPSGFLVRHSPARAMASVTSSRRPVPTNAFTQCFSLPPHSFPHVDATERGFSARRMHRFSCPVGAHTYTGCSTLTTTSPRASACTADICKRDNREWVPAWCMPRCLPGLPAFFWAALAGAFLLRAAGQQQQQQQAVCWCCSPAVPAVPRTPPLPAAHPPPCCLSSANARPMGCFPCEGPHLNLPVIGMDNTNK